ncbi:transcriptional regulator with XRE-family HTH domain [Saccharopolyspora phatthalungensis]|uniref:Transcriptional regulator with XRE-family HTH domain n=1 Tax=Saccharopolyspora phatthalungensis TaxID=664693 RepID=A0A840QK47_9PSEU|nr:transcriptional regulator with XRE-family HTH domain [Saccharopolyspora phatthalungensis]
MSIDYYTRLEQGRERRPSAQLISAIARALRMTGDEQLHMHRLAGVEPTHQSSSPSRTVHPSLRQLMDQWPMNPAFIFNDVQDILAANSLGAALHQGFTERDNVARMLFLDDEATRFFVDWERIALDTTATLRQAWGRPASRRRVEALVEELRTGNEEFDRIWTRQAVATKSHETKRLDHPAVGRLALDYHTFEVSGVTGQYLLVCQAEPGSPDAQALTLLSTLIDAEPGTRPAT